MNIKNRQCLFLIGILAVCVEYNVDAQITRSTASSPKTRRKKRKSIVELRRKAAQERQRKALEATTSRRGYKPEKPVHSAEVSKKDTGVGPERPLQRTIGTTAAPLVVGPISVRGGTQILEPETKKTEPLIEPEPSKPVVPTVPVVGPSVHGQKITQNQQKKMKDIDALLASLKTALGQAKDPTLFFTSQTKNIHLLSQSFIAQAEVWKRGDYEGIVEVQLVSLIRLIEQSLLDWVKKTDEKILKGSTEELLSKYAEDSALISESMDPFNLIQSELNQISFPEFFKAYQDLSNLVYYWVPAGPALRSALNDLKEFYTEGITDPKNENTHWYQFGRYFYPENEYLDLFKMAAFDREKEAVLYLKNFIIGSVSEKLDLSKTTAEEIIDLIKKGSLTKIDYVEPYIYLMNEFEKGYLGINVKQISVDLADLDKFKQSSDVKKMISFFQALAAEKKREKTASVRKPIVLEEKAYPREGLLKKLARKIDDFKREKLIENKIDILLKAVKKEDLPTFLSDLHHMHLQELVDLVTDSSVSRDFFEKGTDLIVKFSEFMNQFTKALESWIKKRDPEVLANYENLIELYRATIQKCIFYQNAFELINSVLQVQEILLDAEFKSNLKVLQEAVGWAVIDPGIRKAYDDLAQFYWQGKDRPADIHTHWHKFGQFFYPKNQKDDVFRNIALERNRLAAVPQLKTFVETKLRESLNLAEGATLDEMLALIKSGTIKETSLDYLDPYIYLIDALNVGFRSLKFGKIALDLQDLSKFKQTEDVRLLIAFFKAFERQKQSRLVAKKKEPGEKQDVPVVEVVK